MRQHALTHKNKDGSQGSGSSQASPKSEHHGDGVSKKASSSMEADVDVELQSEEEEIQVPHQVVLPPEENGRGCSKDEAKSDLEEMAAVAAGAASEPRSNISSPSPTIKKQQRPGSSEYFCCPQRTRIFSLTFLINP